MAFPLTAKERAYPTGHGFCHAVCIFQITVVVKQTACQSLSRDSGYIFSGPATSEMPGTLERQAKSNISYKVKLSRDSTQKEPNGKDEIKSQIEGLLLLPHYLWNKVVVVNESFYQSVFVG